MDILKFKRNQYDANNNMSSFLDILLCEKQSSVASLILKGNCAVKYIFISFVTIKPS